jgi:DNA-binding MarR family transcriptional regulator
MKLTEHDCQVATPKERPYKLFDGGGMYLLTRPSGRKYWRMKYRFGGSEKLLALGVHPEVTLQQARGERDAARQLLARGVDPSAAKAHSRGSTRLTPLKVVNSIAHDVIAYEDDTGTANLCTTPLADVPALDSHLCFALYAAGNHMTRMFVPFLRTLGVTYPQYLVLVVLWERGAHGVGELGKTLNMDFGTLSPMLKRLEGKGLVMRKRDPADERKVVVSLTSKGHELREKTRQMLGEFYCFLNLPLGELFDLKDRLRRFVQTAGPAQLRQASTT